MANLIYVGGNSSINDTLPPQTAITGKAGNNTVTLTLMPPVSEFFAGTLITKKVGSIPLDASDGVKIDVGAATIYVDDAVANDTTYYYRAFAYNAKKQLQTTVQDAIVSLTPIAFTLPTYTGQHAIFGDEAQGRIELYSSGELTLSPFLYDVFMVGGGGGTGKNATGNGGSAGGYTQTLLKQSLVENYPVIVGAGGSSSIGGATTFIHLTANGGNNATKGAGAPGRSGGGGACTESGGSAGSGGSDGNNGGASSYAGGKGQGKTTRAFEDTTQPLYAGGGGGGSNWGNATGGNGGAGGGGRGQLHTARHGTPGTPNTGGGAGGIYNTTYNGGSGIVIIRWGY